MALSSPSSSRTLGLVGPLEGYSQDIGSGRYASFETQHVHALWKRMWMMVMMSYPKRLVAIHHPRSYFDFGCLYTR